MHLIGSCFFFGHVSAFVLNMFRIFFTLHWMEIMIGLLWKGENFADEDELDSDLWFGEYETEPKFNCIWHNQLTAQVLMLQLRWHRLKVMLMNQFYWSKWSKSICPATNVQPTHHHLLLQLIKIPQPNPVPSYNK